MFYVYYLISPIDNEVFYVGMGSGKRMYVHEQKAKRGIASNNNYKLFRKIKEILNTEMTINYVVIAENLTQEDALKLENTKIQEIGLNRLCNLNMGATGRPVGYKHSMETKEKIAKSNTGKIKSAQTKKLIGESKKGNKNMLGKVHSDKTKIKISKSWQGRNLQKYSEGQSHRRKKVIQFSLTGEIVKIWDSITSAVKNNGQSVCDAIYGRQKTAHGYVWKIQEE